MSYYMFFSPVCEYMDHNPKILAIKRKNTTYKFIIITYGNID